MALIALAFALFSHSDWLLEAWKCCDETVIYDTVRYSMKSCETLLQEFMLNFAKPNQENARND